MTTIVKTDCGHDFEKPEHWPEDFAGATCDCPGCGALLLLVKVRDEDGERVIARDFHTYMHERDARWPKDGANTGYVEF